MILSWLCAYANLIRSHFQAVFYLDTRKCLFTTIGENKYNHQLYETIIPGSSMVEQEAVNFEVVGSNPTPGAKHIHSSVSRVFLLLWDTMKL